jgi:hypothetical protein
MYKRPERKHKPNTEKCPFCDKDFKPIDPWRESQCVLNKPLWMVIPPGGVHLECPVHPEGHHVFGSPVIYMDSPIRVRENNLPDPLNAPWCEYDRTKYSGGCTYDHDSSKDLTFDSTKPFGTTTGSNWR